MIRLEHVNIKYKDSLLEDSTLTIPSKKLTVIKGKSGIGKTTLLYRLALITDDVNYKYIWDNEEVDITSKNCKTEIRRNDISYVLQDNDVLEHLSVLQNIEYFASITNKELTHKEVEEMLKRMSLDISLEQNVMTLSLGERQRFLIACALIKEPKLLILDEPTASLDLENEILIFTLLKKIVNEYDISVVISSHSEVANQYADVLYGMENKKIHLINGEYKDTSCKHNNINKKSKNFYIKYVKNYFKYYQFLHVLMMMVATLTLLIAIVVTLVTTITIKENQDILTSQFENKMVVTKEEGKVYVNQKISKYVSKEDISKNETSYPLIKLSSTIRDNEVYIIPYFDGDDFGDSLQLKFNDDKGVYIDYQTFISLNSRDGVTLDGTIYEQTTDGEILTNMPITSNVSGVFKEGVTQKYVKNSKRFIYMYYQDIENIYKMNCTSNQYIGWVQSFKDYQQLKDEKKVLENAGYYVNDDFVNIKVVDDMETYYQAIQETITWMVLGVGITVCILLEYNLHSKRKKEIGMLKLHGFKTRELFTVLFLEMIVEFLLTGVIVLLLSGVIAIIMKANSSSIISMYMVMGKYFMIIIPMVFIETIWFITSVSIEKQLRDK